MRKRDAAGDDLRAAASANHRDHIHACADFYIRTHRRDAGSDSRSYRDEIAVGGAENLAAGAALTC
jgi:tRNA(Ser,Leu) C12 N-acetylase TAN1